MTNCVTDWIFRRQKFCCCLPVRWGTAVLSFLSILFGGGLMLIIWFEVATNYFMDNSEKVAFVLAGLLETCLFVASIFGFIGTCIRKQSFVVGYASFLYFHFFVNLAVAIYFLWMITTVANTDIIKLCQEGIRNQQAQGQCKGLLNVAKGVYWGVSLTILIIEAYLALVVTRYVNQLRYEKRDVRKSRSLHRQSAFDAYHKRFTTYSSYSPSTPDGKDGRGGEVDLEGKGLLEMKEFDPYEAFEPKQASIAPAVGEVKKPEVELPSPMRTSSAESTRQPSSPPPTYTRPSPP